MYRKLGVISGIVICFAVLLTVTGTSQGQSTSALLNETMVLDQYRAAAASDLLSNQWFLQEPFTPVAAGTLWSGNNGASTFIAEKGTFEARRVGLTTQLARIIAVGDPVIGQPLAGNAQLYANAAAASPTSFSFERRYVWALAAVLGASGGFAIVPGGPAQALSRITSCLAGSIQTNQGGLAAGVALDCSAEPIRRALADLIAPGFFVGFGGNPAISASLTCSALLGEATGGSNAETRWAYGKAYVLKGCNTAANVASSGGSYELRQAAVAPLIVAGGGGSGAQADLANAWVTGLGAAFSVNEDPLSCAVTSSLGSNLAAFSVANFGSPAGAAAVPVWARYFNNDTSGCGDISALVASDPAELRHTVTGAAGAGSNLPLMSFVVSKP